MKTKHSPGEDDPITGFCKATSEPRESALFFLEGFSWDLDNAVSAFLQGHLPPVKKPPLQRSRSRSPSRRIYSTATSGLRSKHNKIDADETSKTSDDSREAVRLAKDATHDDITHGEALAPVADLVNHEPDKVGSDRASTDSTSH